MINLCGTKLSGFTNWIQLWPDWIRHFLTPVFWPFNSIIMMRSYNIVFILILPSFPVVYVSSATLINFSLPSLVAHRWFPFLCNHSKWFQVSVSPLPVLDIWSVETHNVQFLYTPQGEENYVLLLLAVCVETGGPAKTLPYWSCFLCGHMLLQPRATNSATLHVAHKITRCIRLGM